MLKTRLHFRVDLLKLMLYVGFFGIVLYYYGFPLHIVRDVYVSFRNLVVKLRDLQRYHHATRNMDEQYPDVTEEELNKTDHICIICREGNVSIINSRDPRRCDWRRFRRDPSALVPCFARSTEKAIMWPYISFALSSKLAGAPTELSNMVGLVKCPGTVILWRRDLLIFTSAGKQCWLIATRVISNYFDTEIYGRS